MRRWPKPAKSHSRCVGESKGKLPAFLLFDARSHNWSETLISERRTSRKQERALKEQERTELRRTSATRESEEETVSPYPTRERSPSGLVDSPLAPSTERPFGHARP